MSQYGLPPRGAAVRGRFASRFINQPANNGKDQYASYRFRRRGRHTRSLKKEALDLAVGDPELCYAMAANRLGSSRTDNYHLAREF